MNNTAGNNVIFASKLTISWSFNNYSDLVVTEGKKFKTCIDRKHVHYIVKNTAL